MPPPAASGSDHEAGAVRRGSAAPSPAHTASSTQTGTSRAVSLSQNWKACTKVIERMPPGLTDASTTSATTSEPAQRGAPIVDAQGDAGALELRQEVEPADGDDQHRAQLRTPRESRRASAKSGSV